MIFWVILAIVIFVLYGIGTYIEKFGAYNELKKMNRRQGKE